MRARLIKPGFFKNDRLAECSPLARLLFEGLWALADREGRLEDRPKKIKAEVLPYDDVNPEELLAELMAGGFIVRYVAAGENYIWIPKFAKHQRPHSNEVPSEIPPWSEGLSTLEASASNQGEQDFALKPRTFNIEPLTREDTHTSIRGGQTAPDGGECACDQDGHEAAVSDSGKKPSAHKAVQPDMRMDDFNAFWSAYPRKERKARALKAWGTAIRAKTLPPQDKLMADLERQKASEAWSIPRYVPLAARWIGERLWEDEPLPDPRPPLRASPPQGSTLQNGRLFSREQAAMDETYKNGMEVLQELRERGVL